MESIYSTSNPKKISGDVFQVYQYIKIEEAVKIYKSFKNNKKNKYINTKHAIRRMANRLGDQNTGYAIRFHKLNLENYPNSTHCLINLGGFLEDAGELEKSKKYYSKAKSLLKIDPDLNDYLKHFFEDFLEEQLLNSKK